MPHKHNFCSVSDLQKYSRSFSNSHFSDFAQFEGRVSGDDCGLDAANCRLSLLISIAGRYQQGAAMTGSLWALGQVSHFLKPISIVLVEFCQLHILRCSVHVVAENG